MFCVYGNPTLDLVLIEGREAYIAYGGGSYYSSLPLIQRGERVRVYAVFSPLIASHPISDYIVMRQYSTRTNVFVLEYSSGTRRLGILDHAPPLYPWNHHEEQCYSIVNPVLGEVGTSVLKKLRNISAVIALDVQGYLRRISNGRLELASSSEAFEAISLADVVHLDLEELLTLFDTSDRELAVYKLSKLAKSVVVVTIRPRRALLLKRGVIRELDFGETPTVIDRTGSGDYYLSSYLYNYIRLGDEEEAAYRAHDWTSKWLLERQRKHVEGNSKLEPLLETLRQS